MKDQQAGSHSYGEAHNIEQGKSFSFDQASVGGFEHNE